MQPFYTRGPITVYQGDCREIAPAAAAAHGPFSACVTDPPYELGFMGKRWDSSGVAFQPETWAAIMQSLAPGAPLFAFGGSRTFHRLVCAIEDAGFEIRDSVLDLFAPELGAFIESLSPDQQRLFDRAFPAESVLAWLYGQGFPKSLDISKALDKEAGAEREVIGQAVYGDGHVQRSSASIGFNGSDPEADQRLISAPATALARLWKGYGTALKPAHEPICSAMKPLQGTFAQNAREHGVAGLNIEAGRIGETRAVPASLSKNKMPNVYGGSMGGGVSSELNPNMGRFPANVCHDGSPEVLDAFARFGEKKNGSGAVKVSAGGQNRTESPSLRPGGGMNVPGTVNVGVRDFGDTGTAARFFYCAKASRRERTMNGQVPNGHPTVKPRALLRWLLSLVTMPERNLIVDPFGGSGTTALECYALGLPCVTVELEESSCEIIAARLEAEPEPVPPPPPPPPQADLFT